MQMLNYNYKVNKDAKKEAKENAAANIESPLIKIAKESGEDIGIKDTFFGDTQRRIYLDKIDPKELKIIQGKSGKEDSTPAGSTRAALSSKGEDGIVTPYSDAKGRKYYDIEANGNWKGKDGTYTVDAAKDATIKTYSDKDLYITSNTDDGKAKVVPVVPKVSMVQKIIDSTKKAIGKGTKIRGTNKKMY
jgi:hypothetical protein